MKKSAVIYIRVSDPSQIDNNSLETQEKICRSFAKTKGIQEIKLFSEEGRSAKHMFTRPELRKAIAYSQLKKNNVGYFIVYKFDRFSRNTEEGLAVISLLAKSGVEVISATEVSEMNPMGKTIRTVLMAFGELDNELKGMRVKDNMIAVYEKGLWPFKCPIGYRRKFKTKEENKGLPPIHDENLAPIIQNMFLEASKGIYNKTQLAKRMNLQGFSKIYGSKATHKTVDNILTKTFYFGKMYAKKWDKYVWGKHIPITDELTWQKAHQYVILKKKTFNYQDEGQYPLKGSLLCDECGEHMTTSPSTSRGKSFYYYECKGCRKLRINREKAHKQFIQLVQEIKPSQRVIKIFNNLVLREWDQSINTAKAEAEKIEERIAQLKNEIKEVAKSNRKGFYTDDEARDEIAEIRSEITILEVEKSDLRIEQYDAEIVRQFIEHFFLNLDSLWEKLDLPKKQAFLKKLFPKGLSYSEDEKIRIIELSPSFQLISEISEKNGKNVTPRGIEPRFSG